MKTKMIFGISFILILAVVLTGCSGIFPSKSVPDNQSAQATAVMSTVSAVLTQQAFETLVAQATQFANPQATATPQILPSATIPPIQPTVIPPTATMPQPTATLPSPTATPKPVPCNWASFIKDVSVPDGSSFASGQKFTKTWQLKNIGTCTWTKDYDLVFSDGSAMSAPAAVSLTKEVRPGETIDVSVELVAPSKAGSYKGYWMLRNAQDQKFGLGDNTDKAFWVSINVSGYHSDDVPSSIYPYDFTASICQARWVGSTGDASAPCANIDQSKSQWAAVLMNPKFEGGRQENERTIWMHLADKGDWLQGFYPAVTINKDNKFVAWVGCLDGNDRCNAEFSLDYKVDGGNVQNLGKWSETNEGLYTKISIDLNQFEGKKVEFILGVSNKNSSGNLDVFWFTPSIQ